MAQKIMWRFLFKLMVFLSLFAGIGNYLVYIKTGRLPLSEIWHRYGKIPTSLPSPSLPPLELPSLPKLGQEDAKAYKWTDANGTVHYSDQAPQGAQVKVVNMDPDRNLLQGSPAPMTNEDAKKSPLDKEKPTKNKPNTTADNEKDAALDPKLDTNQIDIKALQKTLQGMQQPSMPDI